MKQQLGAEGLSFNDIATVIENANGEIEELKYSDSEVEAIFARGVAKGVEQGRVEQARKQQAPPEFYDEFGEPRWLEIAMFCQKHAARLSVWEKEFINSVAGQVMYRPPSPKQTKHLLAIFVKLGGTYHRQA